MKEETSELLDEMSDAITEVEGKLNSIDGVVGELNDSVSEISNAQNELKEQTGTRFDKVEMTVAENYTYLGDTITRTNSELYKSENEIQKRATFAQSFFISLGAIALVAFIVFVCWAGIYAPIYDAAYKAGYIKGHNEVIEKLLPEPDRQTWEHKFAPESH
jgi:hypothetical protein